MATSMRRLLIWVGVRLAALGLIAAMIAPAFAAASWVNDASGQWAGPAAIVSLALGALTGASYFWLKRHAWLVIAPVAFTALFSFTLALMRGWTAQFEAVITGVSLVALGAAAIAVAWVTTKPTRVDHILEEAAREIGDAVKSDSLFRDDGERIVIYPLGRRLLIRMLTSLLLLGLFVGGFLWARANTSDPLALFAVGGLICMITLFALLIFMRLVMRSPALIVGHDGIYDNGSYVVTGRGLLSWDEVLGVYVDTRTASFGMTFHNLGIIVTDARAINARQPLWKRPLVLFCGQMTPISIAIGQSLLDRPTDKLVEQIKDYAKRHAPPGSWHANVDDIPDRRHKAP